VGCRRTPNTAVNAHPASPVRILPTIVTMSLQSSNSFRRSSPRDDRRRRLLSEETGHSADWSTEDRASEERLALPRSLHYGEALFLENQLRLLDLIPRRWVTILSFGAVGTAISVGLGFAYTWMLHRVENGRGPVAALDLASRSSLGCWFSSLLLLAISATMILVYLVRRHRIDDYHGRYRVWLWVAACSFIMAADQATGLREVFRDGMIAMTGTPLYQAGALWWVILDTLLIVVLGSRLLMDMRTSLLSAGMLLGAAALYALAATMHLGGLILTDESRQTILLAGTGMFGNLLVWLATLVYGRQVVRDAEGLLLMTEAELDETWGDDEACGADAQTSDDGWRKIDSPHGVPQPVFQRVSAGRPKLAASTAPSAESTASTPVNRKLTKQEKRALKERLVRERQARERRSA
jgi:hypothetical protein